MIVSFSLRSVFYSGVVSGQAKRDGLLMLSSRYVSGIFRAKSIIHIKTALLSF